MSRTTITFAIIFAILGIGMIGAFVAAWQEGDRRDMLAVSYWVCGLLTASHAVTVFGP